MLGHTKNPPSCPSTWRPWSAGGLSTPNGLFVARVLRAACPGAWVAILPFHHLLLHTAVTSRPAFAFLSFVVLYYTLVACFAAIIIAAAAAAIYARLSIIIVAWAIYLSVYLVCPEIYTSAFTRSIAIETLLSAIELRYRKPEIYTSHTYSIVQHTSCSRSDHPLNNPLVDPQHWKNSEYSRTNRDPTIYNTNQTTPHPHPQWASSTTSEPSSKSTASSNATPAVTSEAPGSLARSTSTANMSTATRRASHHPHPAPTAKEAASQGSSAA